MALCGDLECLVQGTFAPRAVAVDPPDCSVGKSGVERIFESLCTLAEWFDDFTAFVTAFDQGSAGTAVVAAQLPAARVHGESRITALAASDVSAAVADQYRGKSSPVKEDQNLTTGVEVFANGLGQGFADSIRCWRAHRVDESQGRRLCSPGAYWQDKVFERSIAAVLQHFKCGGSASQNNRYIQVLGFRNREIASGIA